ncbi:MAG: hypothetical protein M0Q44_16745 [Methylobacter sp.]|jgi:hypothetical protein|nr:hypothetical protein [Methylobacter sp.]
MGKTIRFSKLEKMHDIILELLINHVEFGLDIHTKLQIPLSNETTRASETWHHNLKRKDDLKPALQSPPSIRAKRASVFA